MTRVLEIAGLDITYGSRQIVSNVDLTIASGEIVGIVGESGSGKSTLALSIPGLLPGSANVTAIRFAVEGDLLSPLSSSGRRQHRAGAIATVFQDPSTSFSPLIPIGRQLGEFLWRQSGNRREKRLRIVEMLAHVGIAEPERRVDAYPHQLSGGMLQRVAIAAALLVRPKLIIADEPTTALDVTTESQILHLFRRIRDEHGTAMLLISHQLGVVAELADRVCVMEQGRFVEAAPVADIFFQPQHPYTRWLLECERALHDSARGRLPTRAA